jgi:hypothetical protein
MRAIVLFCQVAAVATYRARLGRPRARLGRTADAKPKPSPANDKKPAPPPPEPRKPGPHDAKVVAVLEKIVAGPDPVKREAAIAELQKLAPDALEAIGEWIPRVQGRVDVVQRRDVLVAINASIPDKTGKFSTPQRQSGKERRPDGLDGRRCRARPQPCRRGDRDVPRSAHSRATKERAAQLVPEAFSGNRHHRDECGRYSASWSALIADARASAERRSPALRRWRLGGRSPGRDRAPAPPPATRRWIAISRRFARRGTARRVRDVPNNSTRVAAARATWMGYITGKAPPPAPRKKLQMPGGKLTKEEKPMWLTYRELADNELRKAANELLHEDYPIEEPSIDDRIKQPKITPIDLEDVTKRLFAYYARAHQDRLDAVAGREGEGRRR